MAKSALSSRLWSSRRVLPFVVAGTLLASVAPLRAASDDGAAERPSSPAGAPSDAARRTKIAIKVGDRSVTVGELEDRLAEIPPFQAVTFGASRDEIVRAYVEQVIVRDLVRACRALAQAGQTIVLVEQNLAATLALATRVYIINNGHIVHEGPAAELKADPRLLQRYLGI